MKSTSKSTASSSKLPRDLSWMQKLHSRRFNHIGLKTFQLDNDHAGISNLLGELDETIRNENIIREQYHKTGRRDRRRSTSRSRSPSPSRSTNSVELYGPEVERESYPGIGLDEDNDKLKAIENKQRNVVMLGLKAAVEHVYTGVYKFGRADEKKFEELANRVIQTTELKIEELYTKIKLIVEKTEDVAVMFEELPAKEKVIISDIVMEDNSETAEFSMDRNAFPMAKHAVRCFLAHALRDNGERYLVEDVQQMIDFEYQLLRVEHRNSRSKDECDMEAVRKIHVQMQRMKLPEQNIWPDFLGIFVDDLRRELMCRLLMIRLHQDKDSAERTVNQMIQTRSTEIKTTDKKDRSKKMRDMMDTCVLKKPNRTEPDENKTLAIMSLYFTIPHIGKAEMQEFVDRYA